MDSPELLDHPFWTQVLKEEEDVKEEAEDEEGHQEEKNSCEGVGSASSRCVDILLFLYSSCSILQAFCSSPFIAYSFALY